MLVYAAASVGLAQLIKLIYNDVLILHEELVPILAAVLAVYLFKGLGSYVSDYLMTGVGQRVVKDIRDQLFRHIIDQSATFFARRTSGQLISRLTNDVAQVQRAVSDTTGDLVRESLTLVGFVAYIFWLDWSLALVCVVTAPLVIYPLTRLGQRVRSTTKRKARNSSSI